MSEGEKEGQEGQGMKLQGWHVVAAALLSAVGLFYSLTPLWHTDVWGHLRYGAWILEQRSLPATEPFCEFADKDTPLVHFAWGSQLVFVGTFRLGAWLAGGDDMRQLEGGVAALRTLTVFLAVLFCSLLLLACWRISGSLALGVLGLLLYQFLTPGTLGLLRPQLFGMVMFAVLLAQLSRERWGWLDVALTAPLFLLWANLHGSFVVGLGLLGIFLLGRFLSGARAEGRFSLAAPFRDPSFLPLACSVVVAACVACVNPHGPSLYLEVTRFARHPVTRGFDEFQPLNLSAGPGLLLLYAGSIVVLVGSWVMGRKWPSATQVLIVLAFGLAPISQRRLLMWWMPLVVWLVVPSWAELARRRGWSWVGEGSPSLGNTLLTGFFALVALFCLPSVRAVFFGPAPLSQSVTAVTPWRLTRFLNGHRDPSLSRLAGVIERNYPEGRFRGRIFTSEKLGDFLLWDTPEIPVIAYTHSHVFTMQHWQGVMTVKNGAEGWNAWLDRWGVNLVVFEAADHPRLREVLLKDANWQVVLDDAGDLRPRFPSMWLFVAVRKKPIWPMPTGHSALAGERFICGKCP